MRIFEREVEDQTKRDQDTRSKRYLAPAGYRVQDIQQPSTFRSLSKPPRSYSQELFSEHTRCDGEKDEDRIPIRLAICEHEMVDI
jgi:hypothetical protein